MTNTTERKISFEPWLAIVVSIVAGGVSAFVTTRGRSLGVLLDAALLSAGVVLLVYAAIIRRRHREEIEERRFPGRGLEPIPMLKDVRPTFLGVALILAATAGLLSLLALGFQPPQPPPPYQILSLVQRLDKIESNLNECLKSKATEKGCASADDATAAKIEDALRRVDEVLKSHPPQQDGISPWGTFLIVVLALVLAGVIIWLTLRFSPSKTPLAIALSLAVAMIKAAKYLPQPGGHKYYWCAVFSLLVAGAAVIGLGRWLRESTSGAGSPAESHPPPQQPADEPKASWLGLLFPKHAVRPEPNSPLVIGFSLMLLAATLAYVGRVPDKSSASTQPCSACPSSLSLMQFDQALSPVRGFGTGSEAAKAHDLQQFKLELELKKFTDADVLLLLGSTDCVPIKERSTWHSNQELAQARAKGVREAAKQLGTPGSSTIVNAMFFAAVPQAESCSEALDRRAVFPLLFRPQTPAN